MRHSDVYVSRFGDQVLLCWGEDETDEYEEVILTLTELELLACRLPSIIARTKEAAQALKNQ